MSDYIALLKSQGYSSLKYIYYDQIAASYPSLGQQTTPNNINLSKVGEVDQHNVEIEMTNDEEEGKEKERKESEQNE